MSNYNKKTHISVSLFTKYLKNKILDKSRKSDLIAPVNSLVRG